MAKKNDDEIKSHKSGGIFFYITLLSALILATANLLALPGIMARPKSWLLFILGILVGVLLALNFFVGRFSVGCHELKHYLLAAFAGNKYKKMKVNGEDGYYQYSYTRDTAKYNAMIALAPYWFPLMTIVCILFMFPTHYSIKKAEFVLLGIGMGADLIMNTRDISPIQTDLTNVIGGYKIAIIFIIVMNLTILTFAAAWVSGEVDGLKNLFMSHLNHCMALLNL